MALQLKGKANYLNKYEYFHDQLKATSKFFNEDDWYKIARGDDSSNLDMYIDALGKAKDIDKVKYDKDYKTEYEDSETRLAALYNEVYASRIANDDRYAVDVYKYDDAGNMLYDELGNPKTERKTVSEYEYNKMVINQQNSIKETLHLRDLAREAKDPSLWADAAAIGVDVLAGGLDFFNSVYALGATLIDMASSDKTFANDWFTQWDINYKPVLEHLSIDGKTLADHLLDFESKYSHLRDVDGNFTSLGRILSGAATTIGEVSASAGLGRLLSLPLKSLSTASTATKGAKIASMVGNIGTDVVRTATYYTPIAMRSMGESYKQMVANGQSISTAKMFANQGIKTALEIGIERGLAAVLGATGLDIFSLGMKSTKVPKSRKATFLKGLGYFALDAGQEGLEEFLQEFSGYMVDFLSEDFEADLSWQNLGDAFLIGALTSGIHSAATIAGTKGKVIYTPDGKVRLGKVASAYYNASMPTFFNNLKNTQKALDEFAVILPTQQKLTNLENKKAELLKELTTVQNEISENQNKLKVPEDNGSNQKSEYIAKAQDVASEVGKGYRLNEKLELIKNQNQMGPETAQQRKQSLVKQLENVQMEINKVSNIKERVEKNVDYNSTRMTRFAEALNAVYAAARAVQSVAGEIGKERMNKAAIILQKIEDMGKAGKFDEAEVVKARDEMIKELQLSSITIDRSLVSRIAHARMSKIRKIFKREDVDNEVNTDASYREFAENVFKYSNSLKNIVVTEDGNNVVSDERNMFVPYKNVKLGVKQVMNEDAEQRVVQAVLNYNFKGDVISEIANIYRDLIDENGDKYDAVRQVLFDPAFFMSVLTGQTPDPNKRYNIADLNMYQFLSSLYDVTKSLVPKDVRDAVYKKRMNEIKEAMSDSLMLYCIINPFSDYNLSIFSESQLAEIRKYRESYAVGNRLADVTASAEDWNFIFAKLNALAIDSQTKANIKEALESKAPVRIRQALIEIDQLYNTAFYGAFDGKTYMPLNSLKNRTFNHFLYTYGLTVNDISDILGMDKTIQSHIANRYKSYDQDGAVAYYSDLLEKFTDGQYKLKMIKGSNPNYESGEFLTKAGGDSIRIIDTYETNPDFEHGELENNLQRAKDKTISRRSNRHNEIVNNLLNSKAVKKGKNYYTIDDVITNPNLLKKTILDEIRKDIGPVSNTTTYRYIKRYLKNSGSNLTISMSADGSVVFVDLTPMDEVFAKDISLNKVNKVIKGELKFSELLSDVHKSIFADDIKIKITDNENDKGYFVAEEDSHSRLTGTIYINRRCLKDLKEVKRILSHEFQHVIQSFTMMNSGTDDSLLVQTNNKAQAKLIVQDIEKHVPNFFDENLTEAKKIKQASEFIYYGSGEIDAYGAVADVPYYPVYIKTLESNKLQVTMPWGTTYELNISKRSKILDKKYIDDAIFGVDEDSGFYEFNEKIESFIVEGKKEVSEVKDAFYTMCDVDEIIDLADKVFQGVDDVEVKFISQSEIIKIAGRNAAGIYRDGKIYYNSTFINKLYQAGEIEQIAEILLHEFIHARVSDTINEVETLMKGKKFSEIKDQLTDAQLGALSLIQLYRGLKTKQIASNTKIDVYGMSSVQEFVAEFANYDFRQYLKEQTLWEKIINAIKMILGINKNTVYEIGVEALNRVLEAGVTLNKGDTGEIYLKEIKNDEVVRIDHSKHQRSKGRTPRKRVAKKYAIGTPLEPFAGERVSLPLQEFIMKSGEQEYRGIDKSIKDRIKDGTLRTTHLMDYLKEVDANAEAAEITFKLINETIFHNNFITSLKELDEYILVRTDKYYAMRAFFREVGMMEKLMDTGDPELYDTFMSMLENNPAIKKKVYKIAERYWSGPVINEKNLRRLWMQHFDGSVDSAGYIAAVARVAAFQNWKVSSEGSGSLSLSSSVGRGKDKASTLTVENVVPDAADFEDFNRFINSDRIGKLISAMDRELVLDLVQRKQSGENLTLDDVNRLRQELSEEIYALSENDPEQFAKLYAEKVQDDEELANALYLQSLAREVSGKEGEQDIDKVIDDYDRAKNQSKGVIRPKSYVIANIRSINRTIKKNLNAKQAKLFLKDNDDLFEADLSVKKSAYQDIGDNGVVRLKDESILLEIESRLRQLSKDVRAGRYNDEKFLAYRKSMERKIARLEKELLKKSKSKLPEPVTFNLVGEEIYVDTTREMPRAIKRFLETELTKTAKSTTQLLTNDTDVHIQMNYKTFIDTHAELLNSLTQADVDEIIDFYMSSEILPNTNRAKLYTTVQQLLLGYILEVSGSKSMRFTLSKNQIEAVEHRLEFMVSTSATIVSTWHTVLKALKPEETLHKAMLKACDIELSPAAEEELVKAISSGDIKRIQIAKQKAYDEALVRYKGRKRTIFDRLLRYERMAMLSGPGTWVRNIASNIGVTAGNKLSEMLTSLLPQSKKSNRLKQYKITGTKVTVEYSTWIKEQILDSGLLDLISDGLIKYNPRTSNKVTVEDELTRLIVSNVESSLFDEASGVNTVSQFLQKTLKTMMSDKKFIDRSFVRYLGKMMTEDATDISNGLTKDVMNTIAEAYTMAMQDYMHSSSFFVKIEQSLRTYLHRRFSPTTADGIYFMYKQVLPFANASWNWFMEGLNYTPIGLAKGIIQFAKLENTVNNMENARQKGERVRSARFAEYLAKRNIGKGIIGSVGLGIGILLVACGKVQFDDDDDKYKVYINASDGPIVVDISEIFGSNGILLGMAMGQSFVDANGFNYDSFIKVFASSFNTMFMDSTFADMYNTFRYSDSFGDYVTGLPLDVAGMFVPNFVKTVGNTFKKYNVSYSAGLKGQLERFMVQSFAPFSYFMPYAINPYTGEPEVINEGWFGVNLINRYTPIKVKNYEFGDVERIAVSLGVKKGSLTGRYAINDEKVNLTNEELEAVNQFYGKLNKKELDDFTMNRTLYTVENERGEREELKYSKMTDKQKKAVIERIMSNNSQLAKVYILTSNGYKYYADDSEYDDLRNAGVISNVYRKQGKMKGFVKIN